MAKKAASKSIALSELRTHPDNPRYIRDEKFNKLVKSLRDFPEMTEVRPLVVNAELVVLGGNMRLKAMLEAGWKKAPVMVVDWSEEQQKEFMIKDNASFGEWDYDVLANEWNSDELLDWGVDVWSGEPEEEQKDGEKYTGKVESPVYEAKGLKPPTDILYDDSKYLELCEKIDGSTAPEEDKRYLKMAATRHIVFSYRDAAEYYAHSDKEVQELMEESALVIVDFNQAIENGIVKLGKGINALIDEQKGE